MKLTLSLKFLVGLSFMFGGVFMVSVHARAADWVEPSCSPFSGNPLDCNVAAPINVSQDSQAKLGYLRVGGSTIPANDPTSSRLRVDQGDMFSIIAQRSVFGSVPTDFTGFSNPASYNNPEIRWMEVGVPINRLLGTNPGRRIGFGINTFAKTSSNDNLFLQPGNTDGVEKTTKTYIGDIDRLTSGFFAYGFPENDLNVAGTTYIRSHLLVNRLSIDERVEEQNIGVSVGSPGTGGTEANTGVFARGKTVGVYGTTTNLNAFDGPAGSRLDSDYGEIGVVGAADGGFGVLGFSRGQFGFGLKGSGGVFVSEKNIGVHGIHGTRAVDDPNWVESDVAFWGANAGVVAVSSQGGTDGAGTGPFHYNQNTEVGSGLLAIAQSQGTILSPFAAAIVAQGIGDYDPILGDRKNTMGVFSRGVGSGVIGRRFTNDDLLYPNDQFEDPKSPRGNFGALGYLQKVDWSQSGVTLQDRHFAGAYGSTATSTNSWGELGMRLEVERVSPAPNVTMYKNVGAYGRAVDGTIGESNAYDFYNPASPVDSQQYAGLFEGDVYVKSANNTWGNLWIDGNVRADNNETASVLMGVSGGGDKQCPAGQFMTGINRHSNGGVLGLYCSEL